MQWQIVCPQSGATLFHLVPPTENRWVVSRPPRPLQKKNNLVDCARRNKLGTSHDRAQLSTADQPSTAGHSRVQPRTADQPSEPCSHQDRKAARLLVQAFFFLFRFMRFDSYLRVMHCFFLNRFNLQTLFILYHNILRDDLQQSRGITETVANSSRLLSR
jgi:hypothetical protein